MEMVQIPQLKKRKNCATTNSSTLNTFNVRSPANFQRLPSCEPHDVYSHTSLKLLNYLNAVLTYVDQRLLKMRLNTIKNNVTKCTMNGTKLNVRFEVVTFLNYSQLEMHKNLYQRLSVKRVVDYFALEDRGFKQCVMDL